MKRQLTAIWYNEEWNINSVYLYYVVILVLCWNYVFNSFIHLMIIINTNGASLKNVTHDRRKCLFYLPYTLRSATIFIKTASNIWSITSHENRRSKYKDVQIDGISFPAATLLIYDMIFIYICWITINYAKAIYFLFSGLLIFPRYLMYTKERPGVALQEWIIKGKSPSYIDVKRRKNCFETKEWEIPFRDVSIIICFVKRFCTYENSNSIATMVIVPSNLVN